MAALDFQRRFFQLLERVAAIGNRAFYPAQIWQFQGLFLMR